MAKYRSKPFQIEAIQWTGTNLNEIRDFSAAHNGGGVYLENKLVITTLQGEVKCDIGDMIIVGPGELYPCKPEVFNAKYERIDG